MQRLERRTTFSLFNAHLDPRPARRLRLRRLAEANAVAQDFLQYSLDDYDRRRTHGAATWRDLCPAYAFALSSHSADWPRGSADIDDELAAHWELVRGESRLEWRQARAVVEDAWRALDHMPVAAIRHCRQ
ncbi:hypothetical protein [Stenotrophomonas sp. YIM B06876]|uniref:hypothetical protein n=1 Tax=Stenotrophomonas sp. YIM B06876 TaxID=3060211 RepID=UPI00273A590F|nr:hypothetical protein [Stenotrophomonas sp. YIM B06876]